MRITYPQGNANGPQRELPFNIGVIGSPGPSLDNILQQIPAATRVQVKILNLSRREVERDLKRAVHFTHSRLFKQLHDDVFGVIAPCPFGLLLCNWDYDASPASVELLQQLSQIAQAIHAPLIATLSPAFNDNGNVSDLAIRTNPQYAKWRSFSAGDSAQFVILVQPHQEPWPLAARLAAHFEQHGWFQRADHLFSICRVAHYARALLCDYAQPFASIEDCEHTLNAWVAQYVSKLPEPVNRPLLQADIQILASKNSPLLLLAIYVDQSYLLNPMPEPAVVFAPLPLHKIEG